LFARQLGAGALARTLALLKALVVVCDAGQSRVAGVILRAEWETWLVGMYCLLAPKEAVADLTAAHAHHMAKIDERWGLGGVGRLGGEKWLGVGGKKKAAALNYREIAKRTDERADARGVPVGAEIGYDRLYMGESTYTAHAGLASIMRHLSSNGVWSVRLRPAARPAANETLYMGAQLAASLARVVFLEFGLNVSALEALGKRFPSSILSRRSPRYRRAVPPKRRPSAAGE